MPDAQDPFRAPVPFGRTGLTLFRLGLGASYGAPARAYEEAFERGVNYFYWGTRRHPEMGEAIRRIARGGGRARLHVAVQSYSPFAGLLAPSVGIALKRLRLDYADFLILGLWNRRLPHSVVDTVARLKEEGRVRHVVVSAHDRPMFETHLRQGVADAIMVRYNAAHRGAEGEVFPHVAGARGTRPGVITYTTTRWGHLLDPARLPRTERAPRGRDCYRFSLSHPAVDMVLAGPASAAELREALAALEEGPMSEEELAWMRRVGDAVHGTRAADNAFKAVVRS